MGILMEKPSEHLVLVGETLADAPTCEPLLSGTTLCHEQKWPFFLI